MKTILSAGLLVALALTSVVSAGTLTATIGASQDATIYAINPNNSLVAGPGMFAGVNGMTGGVHRGLIEFNVAGSIPAGSIIQSVKLNLTVGMPAGAGGQQAGGAGDEDIELHDVTSKWGVTTGVSATGADFPGIGGTGQLFAANPGDVTWNDTFHGTGTGNTDVGPTTWTTPGGDFKAAASASLIVGPTIGATSSWSSTVAGNAGLVSDVQNWLDHPTQNFGWMVKNADETTKTDFLAFYTKEATSIMGVTAGELPQLIVTYTLTPEPASSTLVGIGLAICGAARLAVRRRKTIPR
jgi:hypothetical protein